MERRIKDTFKRFQELKSEQKQLRTSITSIIKGLSEWIRINRSRRGIRSVLFELKTTMNVTTDVYDRLLKAGLSTKKLDEQVQRHLLYAQAAGATEEEVNEHLESRVDDGSSIATKP